MRKLALLVSLLLFASMMGFAQTRSVSGSIVNVNGTPVPFATVSEKGTRNEVSADENGNFIIKVPTTATLVVSAAGYVASEFKATDDLARIVLSFGGKDVIEEVIVTASGNKMTKNKVGYANTSLTAENLTQANPQNVTSALAGKVPGLQINQVDGGVNPNFSVVLRGYRSITGNNQALLVLDNVIVPNAVISNLNPNDIENITVLNGASAAALYGSQASNGALIITSKKGSYTAPEVTFSQNITRNSVAFYPKFQKKFGAGSDAYVMQYNAYENQQYGPAYDGTVKDFGDMKLPSGKGQTVKYAWDDKNGKLNFWQPSTSSQTDFSVSMPTGKTGRIYVGAQYLLSNGVVEGDKFQRSAISLGGSQKPYESLTLDYSLRYTLNSYEQTSALSTIYDLILNTPGNAPITQYKNWRKDSFAMPDFYYNAFYNNPYFIKDNNRSLAKNNYLVGNISLKYSPFQWLDLIARIGGTSRENQGKDWSDIYRYSAYAKANTNGSYKKSDITGGVSESMYSYQNLISDLQAKFSKRVSDFDLSLTVASQIMQTTTKSMSSSISGLAVPGIFNLSNRLSNPSASEGYSRTRTVGLYADFYGTWRDMVTLHLTGRRDEVSVLDPGFNVFYYPAGDVSLLLHKLIPAIGESKVINALKLRGAMSNVGNVNIGAYATLPTVGQGAGYPYSSNLGYSIGNTIVSQGLKPEYTFSKEIGFDADLLDNRVSASLTVYGSETKNQTIYVSLTQSTGYTSLLTNTGNTTGSGLEASLNVVPIRQNDLRVSVGANYTYNNNKVKTLGLGDLKIYRMLFYGDGTGVYAAEGKAFPALYAVDYIRDSASGKVIVDAITGYPTIDPNIKYAGNTQPLHRFGLTLDVDYKQFTFRSIAEYRGGYVMYNGLGGTLDFSGSGINTAMYNRERFVFPNSVYKDPASGKYVENTNVQIADGVTNFWTQAVRRSATMNYVTSGSFWKLREMSIAYRAPKSLLGHTKFIKGAEIALIGRNLFILTPKENVYTDPEYTSSVNGTGNSIGLNDMGQIPPSRYYGATITFKF